MDKIWVAEEFLPGPGITGWQKYFSTEAKAQAYLDARLDGATRDGPSYFDVYPVNLDEESI